MVQDAKMAHVGYVASVTLKAYDVMTLTFGYTNEGVCTGLAFLDIKETPGIGMKADEPEFKNQFIGNKAERFVSVKSGAVEGEINAISGATFTTDGVITGVNAGICFMKELQTRLGGAN
jgi:electron transport complex protein RnfG